MDEARERNSDRKVVKGTSSLANDTVHTYAAYALLKYSGPIRLADSKIRQTRTFCELWQEPGNSDGMKVRSTGSMIQFWVVFRQGRTSMHCETAG